MTPADHEPDPDKRHAPATQRNREPILAVLKEELAQGGTLLEVASGTGEHAVFLSRALPNWQWQPSDPAPDALASIAAWRAGEGPANLLPPVQLDAAEADWPVQRADAVLCINMIHISPWSATLGLLAGARRVLGSAAPLILYGPYVEDGVKTALSNLRFHQSLRARDPRFGLRKLANMDEAAAQEGFTRTRRVAMPANNLVLVYRQG